MSRNAPFWGALRDIPENSCEGASRVKLEQRNIVTMVTSAFAERFVFKMFSVHTKTHRPRVKIPQVSMEKLRFRDETKEGLIVEI